MLQSSSLISQQVQRGIGISEAFISTILDIYCSDQCVFESNLQTKECVGVEIKKVLNSNIEHMESFNDAVTLRTTNINYCSRLGKVIQQISQLETYMDSPKKLNFNALLYSIMHYYSVTSFDDLSIRYKYLERYLTLRKFDTLKNTNDILYKYLNNQQYYKNTCLPMDGRWLLRTCHENMDLFYNKLFLIMYYVSYKSSQEPCTDRIYNKQNNKFTLLQYMNSVKLKKIEVRTDDAVLGGLLNLLDSYDYFIDEIFQCAQISITESQLIEIISLLKWRFILYQSLKSVLANSISSEVISNIHVHVRWFMKFSYFKIKHFINATVDDSKILPIMNRMHSNLESKFGILQKIGRCYQKIICKPPPLKNLVQYDIRSDFEKILEIFDTGKLNEYTLGLVVCKNAIIQQLIDTKSRLSYEFEDIPEEYVHLKETYDNYKNSCKKCVKKESVISTLPIIDYFSLLNLYRVRCNFIETLKCGITIPLRLQGCLKYYSHEKDKRLLHEIKTSTTYYLLNNSAVRPELYIQDTSMEKKLNLHSPLLTHSIVNLLISPDSSKGIIANFEQCNDIVQQRRYLNSLLWRNSCALSEDSYDYV